MDHLNYEDKSFNKVVNQKISMRQIGITFFFFIFLAVGLLYFHISTQSFIQTLQEYSWNEISCSIVASTVKKTAEGKGIILIKYSYQYKNNKYIGSQFRREEDHFSYSDAVVWASRYRPDHHYFCYVNPDDPKEAVLKRGRLSDGFAIPFSMVFVIFGVTGIIYNLSLRSKRVFEFVLKIIGKFKFNWVALFFSAFLMVGLGILYIGPIRVAVKVYNARAWNVIPCKVLLSEVRCHEDDDGATYSVDILFSYENEGIEYKSNTYDFLGGSSSAYERKRLIVDNYPVGEERTCYVNPNDPKEAVLFRGFLSSSWVLGAMGLIFFLVGFFGMFSSLRAETREEKVSRLPRGPLILKPKMGFKWKIFGSLSLAVIWNGVILIPITQNYSKFPSSISEWFEIFTSFPFAIFAILGVIFIWAFLSNIMTFFNPRVEIKVDSISVHSGEEFSFTWSVLGDANRYKCMKIDLYSVETRKVIRGERTVKEVKEVEHFSMVDSINVSHDSGTRVSQVIPKYDPPSTEKGDVTVTWTLRVKGKIPLWPSTIEDYEIFVLPDLKH